MAGGNMIGAGHRRFVAVALTVLAACGPGGGTGRPGGAAFAVGTRTDAYVDPSRPTPPSGNNPGSPIRTLNTTVWYPATDGSPGGEQVPPATGKGPLDAIAAFLDLHLRGQAGAADRLRRLVADQPELAALDSAG